MKKKWMVTIRCFTFNQSPYICDALNGFVMQQTNFPFVILVVDDASTDGEQEVIRAYVKEQFDLENKNIAYEKETDYASITFAQHRTNKNCYIVVHYLRENHYSNRELKCKKMSYLAEWRDDTKYEAMCEGDDYWIDPLKLQKQVDFLEKNLDYGLCFTDFNLTKGRRNHKQYIPKNDCYFPDILIKNGIQIGTLTVVYRTEIYNRLKKHWVGQNFKMGDLPLWIEIAHESKLKYLPEITAHYRVLTNSASHNSDTKKEIEFYESSIKCLEYYKTIYVIKEEIPRKKAFASHCLKLAYKHQDKAIANKYLKIALKEGNCNFKTIVFYLATVNALFRRMVKMIYND